jgi:hypothetical protein
MLLLRRSGERQWNANDGSKIFRWFYGINNRSASVDRVDYLTGNHAILAQNVANAMIVHSAFIVGPSEKVNFDMGRSTLALLQCAVVLCVLGPCSQMSELGSQMICLRERLFQRLFFTFEFIKPTRIFV